MITSVILFCWILIFSSCAKDELSIDDTMINEEPKIAQAKSWFEDYKAKESFYPFFRNINYHWDQAAVKVLEDGSKAITVPLTDVNPDPQYKGEKILYLYPFEKSYDAVVYELIPDPDYNKKNTGFQNLDSYYGYISSWDLKKGFIKGQKFANSKAVDVIKIKILSAQSPRPNNSTSKNAAPPEPVELNEVIIKGTDGRENKTMGYSYVSTGGSFGSNNLIGSNTDNYFNHSHGSSGTNPSKDDAEQDPCDKINKLIEDIKHKKALIELKKNFGLQQESGYFISKSMGYSKGIPEGYKTLKASTLYSDTYGVVHVHEDSFAHQVYNGGPRTETVHIYPMFSPGDVNTFCSFLIRANKYKTSSLDEVFNEMVTSSGTYQLRFEGDINNVKNFKYEDFDDIYKEYMGKYSNDLESGLLTFIKEYIGIDGITLYKINDDGTSEKKTFSDQNGLVATPCNNIKK